MSNPDYGLVPISKSSWHSKLFNFGQLLWCNFWDKSQYDYKNYVRNINLCQYIRTILVKTPVVLFTIVSTYSVLLYTFLIFPFIYFPNAYLDFLMVLLIIIAVNTALVFTVVYLLKFYEKRKKQQLENLKSESYEEWLEKIEKKRNQPPTFFKLLCQRIRDHHDKFCRLLEFKE